MNLSSSGFRADLRTPLLTIILLQVVLATLCFFAADASLNWSADGFCSASRCCSVENWELDNARDSCYYLK